MKRYLLFALGFLALTLPLTWLWVVWGRLAYGAFFHHVAGVVYGLVGLDGIPAGPRERYVNFIPFLGLMVVTPGFAWAARLRAIGIGVALLFVSHLVLNALASLSTSGSRVLPIPVALVSDTMPFILWAVIARQFILEGVARVGAIGPPPPARGDAKREDT